MPYISPPVLDLPIEFGTTYWDFAVVMFIETATLFVIIGALDLILLRRLRTVVRYAVWSLLLFRLLLPTALPGPLNLLGMDDDFLRQLISRHVAIPARDALPDWAQRRAGPAEEPTTLSDGETSRFVEPAATLASLDLSDGLRDSLESEALVLRDRWTLLFWTAGVAILSALLFVRLLQVRRLIRSSTPVDPELQALFLDVQHSLKVSPDKVKLRLSPHVHSPAICGFWNVTILIPQSLATVFSHDQLRLIMAHELIHWRRGDLHWNTLQSLLQIAYFYNPFVWFTNSLLRRLREYRVDEETVIATGISVEQYAATLVDVTALSRLTRSIPALSLGIVETRSILAARVQRLLTRSLPSSTRLGWRAFLATIVLAVNLLPLSGCHRLIGAFINPDSVANEEWFDLNAQDPRSIEAMQDERQGVADKMLQQEALPERRLAAAGLAEKRLTAAGITDVAPDELVGIVVDGDLRPIAGVTVDAYSWDPGDVTLTDDRGVFRLKELDPKETPPLYISKAGYSPRVITGRSTGQKDLIVILGNQTRLDGVVTGPDNKPIKGARIIASCGGFEYSPGHHTRPIPFETTSGADGSYRIDLFSNKYDVKVSAPGVGVSRRTGIVVEPNQSVPLPVQLEQGIRFEAIVVDSETDQPFEGFVLYTPDPPRVSARSGAQGRLVLEDLFPGIIKFQCGAGDKLMNGDIAYWLHGPLGRWWSPDAIHINEQKHQQPYFDESGKLVTSWQYNNLFLTFDVRPDIQPVKIIVEQGVTVTGQVTDPDGKPVAGATVAAVLCGLGRSPSNGQSVTTDNEGRYRSILPASYKSQYNMVAHDGQYREWRTWANGVGMPLQTKPGQVIENVDLQLAVPGVIRGRITSFGKPVANRTVFSQSCDGCERGGPTVDTAADGTFELKFVRPGKHYVQAEPRYSPEIDPKGYRVVDVKSGVVVDNVNLDFKGK